MVIHDDKVPEATMGDDAPSASPPAEDEHSSTASSSLKGASGSSKEEREGEEHAAPRQAPPAAPARRSSRRKLGPKPNNVRKIRIERMLSKAELARRANVSVLTVDRVERGFGCRVDTKRKLLEALGLSLADRVKVFGEEE